VISRRRLALWLALAAVAPEVLAKYQDAAHCPATGDGWYYDDNADPTQSLLCKNTCAKVGNDTMGCQRKLPGRHYSESAARTSCGPPPA
jgi:hypothetical protein